MRALTATEAARRFSAVLDDVEHRRASFVVTRNGRRIARIEPAAPATVADVLRVLREHPVDPDWAEELRELRASLPVQERDWDG